MGCEASFPAISKIQAPKQHLEKLLVLTVELSFRTSSEDASQAFPITGKSRSAVEKLPRCFLFILFYF